MKLLKDYLKLLKHKNNIKKMDIEDVNEILLSKKYYPFYGEYGLENFLNYYQNEVKILITRYKNNENNFQNNKKFACNIKIF